MSRRAVLLVLCLVAVAGRADDGWRRVDVEDGIAVDAREVEGSSLHEVRATTHADVTPAALLAVVWRYEEHAQFVPRLLHAEVLRDAGDERIVYEQIALPVLKDRDVVLRARRSVDPATGAIDVTTTSITGEGPPPSSRFVRVESSAGHWHAEPAPGGGSDVVYTIRTDPGGRVPDWIVNRAQREAVPDLVRAMLKRAASKAGGSPDVER